MSSRKQPNDAAASSSASTSGSTRANRTSSSSPSPSTSSAKIDDSGDSNGDELFEPSVDMMVNDFDDETTLEMEEQMASSESQDPNAELNSLQEEGDMPIEQLLALYNCVPPVHKSSSPGSRTRGSRTSRNANRDKALMPPPQPPKPSQKSIADDGAEPAAKRIKAEESDDLLSANIKTEAMETDETEDEKPPVTTEVQEESDTKSNEQIVSSDVKVKVEAEDGEQIADNKEAIQTAIQTARDSSEEDKADVNDLKAGTSVKREPDEDDEEEENEDEEEDETELKKLYPETYKTKERRLLRANSHPNSDDEEDEDNDYTPEDDEFKKKIMVGNEYQAHIPDGLCQYDDALPYENEDKLVWDPSQLDECDTEVYLQRSTLTSVLSGSPGGSPGSSLTASPTSQSSTNSFRQLAFLPCGSHLRDDEQCLYLLLQCGYNSDEALRRRRLNAMIAMASQAESTAAGVEPQPALWSEEECRNFESGMRVYGKDFYAIQQSKVRTRRVSELVQFYYLWKKTERHDIFANKTRLEKKKYNLHPGLTDFMDRFVEEQENNGGINLNSTSTSATHGNNNGNERARSMSPLINRLMIAEARRHRMAHDRD